MSDPADPTKKEEDTEEVEEEPKLSEEERKAEEEKKRRQQQVQKRKEEIRKKAEERKKGSATTAPPSPPKPIREDVVASCVNFLNHPKVKSSPEEQKILFLKKKGLSQEEIDEAMRRANASSTSTTTPAASLPVTQPNTSPVLAATPQQPMPYPPYPQGYAVPPPGQWQPQPLPQQLAIVPASSSWYNSKFGLFSTAVSCVSIGVGIALLAKRYLFKDGEEEAKIKALQLEQEAEKKKKKDEEEKASQKLMDEFTNSLKAMQNQNNDMKELLKTLVTQTTESKSDKLKQSSTNVTDNNTKMLLSEMQSQLNTLKAQMVDLKAASPALASSTPNLRQSWSPMGKPSIPSWQQTSSTSTQQPQILPSSQTIPQTQQPVSTSETTVPIDEAPKLATNEMVQRGERPPDIKDINDKPIDPNAKIERGERESPAKPWLTHPKTDLRNGQDKVEELQTKDAPQPNQVQP